MARKNRGEKMNINYDVIIIGAGHAGCEAALSAARLGAKSLLITINMDHIAQMSCNPAIGGIAKGHVVREIDALGGAMGAVTDASTIQFRMLNSSKGPAVWSPRAQCDKVAYQKAMKFLLEKEPNLDIKQALVEKFIISRNVITGIETEFGEKFYCKSLIIATGTFLSGLLHYGLKQFEGGRSGDIASVNLAKNFKEQLNLKVGRLKTGTPPRILAKTIDFSKMQVQDAEHAEEYFSHYNSNIQPAAIKKNMPCYMVYSNQETAKIVNDNIEEAPMYQGTIKGVGARYCPSFEDKIVRFPHHERHLLHLEPEGEFTEEYYINGISTSLPPNIQTKMLQTIPGMENCVISRYAYAIEYDFIYPYQIERSLCVKKWKNLYLAGQINGTSGYEEAAAQGLIAGLNSARFAAGKENLELSRDSSYIGVMIDDLVTKEIIEPYRLFTSRAEYRLRLRQDNADLRLSQFAYDNGLLSKEKYDLFSIYALKLKENESFFNSKKYNGKTLYELIKNKSGRFDEELPFPKELCKLNLDNQLDRKILKQITINAHYEGYLKREDKSIQKLQKLEKWKIPQDFDYDNVKGMRNEARIKLKNTTPTTLSQASRIDGVTPAEIALLQIKLKKQNLYRTP